MHYPYLMARRRPDELGCNILLVLLIHGVIIEWLGGSNGFEKLDELQKELLRLANSKANYEDVADEIYRLRELKQSALVENAEQSPLSRNRISAFGLF